MAQSWQSVLERWRDAGLIDSATAERIHAYEQTDGEPATLSWPVRIAIGFGALGYALCLIALLFLPETRGKVLVALD